MIRPVVLRHQATEDLLAACDYLEAQRPGLGTRLVREVRRVLERITTHPELHGRVYEDVRRAAVKRFSYGVFYKSTPDRIEVLAVFHDSRDPDGLQSRT